MEPIVLFGIQFTLSLVAYALLAAWYVVPRLSTMAWAAALVPLLCVHVFRVVGGTILRRPRRPRAVRPALPRLLTPAPAAEILGAPARSMPRRRCRSA